MWKKYISNFEQCHKTDLKKYILDVSKQFNTSLYSFKEIEKIKHNLSKNNDLFPTSFFLLNLFTHKNSFKLIISLMYYFDELKKINFIFNEKHPEDFVKNSETLSIVSMESLLFKNYKERTLNFLFFYFMPNVDKEALFSINFKTFSSTRTTWLSNNLITINHFNMLLFLIEKNNIRENHKNLLDNTIEAYNEAYPIFNENKFPVKKISILLKNHYTLNNIVLSQEQKNIIDSIIIKLKNEKLNKALLKKKSIKKPDKI